MKRGQRKFQKAAASASMKVELKDLAHEVKKEIPISAVITALPRPNQAFWTLSALWAGWLWGREAVEPYKIALRRRRYDWAWNATALHAAFAHLFELLPLGTPFFGLLPEAEPSFLTSALTAAGAAGFDLKSLALRTEHDPIQMVWERGEQLHRESMEPEMDSIRGAVREHLSERGEPAGYLHVHAAALIALAESHALRKEDQGFDDVLRKTQSTIEATLNGDSDLIHYSGSESVETGLWGLRKLSSEESLTDRVEVAVVNFPAKESGQHLPRNRRRSLSALSRPADSIQRHDLCRVEFIRGKRWRELETARGRCGFYAPQRTQSNDGGD